MFDVYRWLLSPRVFALLILLDKSRTVVCNTAVRLLGVASLRSLSATVTMPIVVQLASQFTRTFHSHQQNP